jgi:gustatory receptor
LEICAHFEILYRFDYEKKEFIEEHQKVIDLASDLNMLIKPIVFTQHLVSSLLLCVIGFQLVMLHDLYKRLAAFFFGLAAMIQLLMYSFGGQQIMDKSLNVSSKMYNLDKDYRMIIMRSHRVCKIRAGIFEASLPTYRTMISNAGSLMTILKSFVE